MFKEGKSLRNGKWFVFFRMKMIKVYPIVSGLSFLIRAYLCYLTIEQIPIIDNPVLSYLIGEIISLYSILWIFSYFTNSVIINKYDIRSSTARACCYFPIYMVYLAVLYGVLVILSVVGVLPIIVDI